MKVKILADSASDLSSKWYETLKVEVVPVHVFIDDEEYLDGVTIQPKEMYAKMRDGKRVTTSQPSPEAFKAAFLQSAKTNTPLVYFSLSATLSGTYNSAKIMEKEIKEQYPEAPIHIIDTGCVSLGYGLIIIRVARLANKGGSLEEIIEIGKYHAKHMEHIFTVDDLEYLYRSGRLNRAASIIGSLLRIKPILHIKDGNLELLENVRGSKRILGRIIAIAKERGEDFRNQTLGIVHADNESTASRLKELVREKLGARDIIIESLGAGVGAHAGPGVVALVFLNNKFK